MFRTKRRILDRTNYGEEVERHLDYKSRLNFYETPPQMQMRLDEFELWAADRVKVLTELERMNSSDKPFQEIIRDIEPTLNEYMPLSISNISGKVDRERRKDHYSHFILRLAFCRTAQLRAKFVQLETLLFKIRYETDDSHNRARFIDSLNLEWEQVDEREKEELFPQLKAAYSAADGAAALSTDYFKINFEKVSDLVRSRRVFLRGGKAYIPNTMQSSLIATEFSTRLLKAMEQTARLLPRLDEDDRLVPVLKYLADDMEGRSQYNAADILSGEVITAEMVDGLDQEGYFPLCMSTMHKSLKRNRHAKFDTRHQYSLFLMSIGLSVDESLKFFTKQYANDNGKLKEYLYYVRHLYGLEGRRSKHKRGTCVDICNSKRTSPNDPQGCPYQSDSMDILTKKLADLGITNKENLDKIKDYVNKANYPRACTEVYNLTHPGYEEELLIDGPDAYFARAFKANRAAATANTSTTPAATSKT